MSPLVTDTPLHVRAAANKWISDNFPTHRRFLSHGTPSRSDNDWRVNLLARDGKDSLTLAELVIALDGDGISVSVSLDQIADMLDSYMARDHGKESPDRRECVGQFHDFRFGDGIAGADSLDDLTVDLLLTDPPYGISKTYTCERQVPRRLRKNGTDFIMPKGHFGAWDGRFPSPSEWTAKVLPKVRGWAVIFCAQAQIGEYENALREHKFIAVGAMVWQKTNPVPFNHRFKPINAWEAIAIGKRPGTKFRGQTVHNVFVCKSPSPQERIHPTQKPLSLISEFIDLFSDEGDTILDPFAGSATTVAAAIPKGRHILAFENDEDIYNKATARIGALGGLV